MRTKVEDYRCPIEVGQVWIKLGDLVFADMDGILIISHKVEAEVIKKSIKRNHKRRHLG